MVAELLNLAIAAAELQFHLKNTLVCLHELAKELKKISPATYRNVKRFIEHFGEKRSECWKQNFNRQANIRKWKTKLDKESFARRWRREMAFRYFLFSSS